MSRHAIRILPAAGRAVLSSPFTAQELEALLIGSSDVVLVLDRRGRHCKVACSDPDQLVTAPEAMLGKLLEEVLPADLARLGRRTLGAVLRDARPRRIRYGLPLANGERHFEALIQPVDADHALWIARDVTEQQATAAALSRRYEASALLTRISARLMDLPPIRLDTGVEQALADLGAHLAVDRAYIYRLTADGDLLNSHAWPAAPAGGRTTRRHVPAAELPWVLARLHKRHPVSVGALDELPKTASADRASLTVGGIRSLIMVPIYYGGALRGLLGFESVDEPREWRREEQAFALAAGELLTSALQRSDGEEVLFRLAYYDHLTGLPNRQLQFEHLERRLKAGGAPFAVALLDIDDSRLLNDLFGHERGDQVLRGVADRLREALAPGQNLCRWGSDEFMLTVPAADADAAVKAAAEIREAVMAPIAVGGHDVRLSCCVGTAHFSTDGADTDALVRAAETALRRAREHGRGSLQRFLPQLREQAARRSRILSALRRALDGGGFSLDFQPQFRVHDNAMVGVEALLRLHQDPELGTVTPDEFIPVAEENGLIGPIGDWVAQEACREVAAWPTKAGRAVKLAINVSPQQLLDDRLLPSLRGAVREHGLAPGQIELEITETVLMEPDHVGVIWLRRLRKAGFGIAVDDFGTGYSSLGKLKALPTTALKIDRSFIRDLLADDGDRAIVRAIIAMAHQLQLHVVAEGVETAGQLAFLRENGCDLAQGFHCARPQPASEARRLWSSTGPSVSP